MTNPHKGHSAERIALRPERIGHAEFVSASLQGRFSSANQKKV
jgi:hypothetical protein